MRESRSLRTDSVRAYTVWGVRTLHTVGCQGTSIMGCEDSSMRGVREYRIPLIRNPAPTALFNESPVPGVVLPRVVLRKIGK